jgi:hypothetical protein
VDNFEEAGIYIANSTNLNFTDETITNSRKGVWAHNSSGVEIHNSVIMGNGIGVGNDPLGEDTPWVNATHNWWGSPSGPSRIHGMEYSWRTPSGNGDYVTNYVYFDPWINTSANYTILNYIPHNIDTCEWLVIKVRVTNPTDYEGDFVVKFTDNGRIVDVKTLHLAPGESKIVVFHTYYVMRGVHHIRIGDLPEFEVVVGSVSTERFQNNAQRVSIIWTLMFFYQSDRFNELYKQAVEEEVDNETLSMAMKLYNNSTELILKAWGEEDLDVLRGSFWARGFARFIYMTRDAYLTAKRAVELLESALHPEEG